MNGHKEYYLMENLVDAELATFSNHNQDMKLFPPAFKLLMKDGMILHILYTLNHNRNLETLYVLIL